MRMRSSRRRCHRTRLEGRQVAVQWEAVRGGSGSVSPAEGTQTRDGEASKMGHLTLEEWGGSWLHCPIEHNSTRRQTTKEALWWRRTRR